jgi:hypothetical protein
VSGGGGRGSSGMGTPSCPSRIVRSPTGPGKIHSPNPCRANASPRATSDSPASSDDHDDREIRFDDLGGVVGATGPATAREPDAP